MRNFFSRSSHIVTYFHQLCHCTISTNIVLTSPNISRTQSAISPGRYLQLMSTALVEMVWDTGLNIYIIWFNTLTGLRPWIRWENVHSNFSRVGVIPEFLNPPEFTTQLIWQWWIVPISCFLFFVFLGFGAEAMSDYRAAFLWFRCSVLRQNIDKPHLYGDATVLPSYWCVHCCQCIFVGANFAFAVDMPPM